MTELDFDELDKSVAQAMADQSNNGENQASSATDNFGYTPSSQGYSTNNISARPERPVIPQRRGKFMDIIRPNNTMKATSQSVSRTAAVVKPIQNVSSVSALSGEMEKSVTPELQNTTDNHTDFPALQNTSSSELIEKTTSVAEQNQANDIDQTSPFLTSFKPEKRPIDAFKQTDQRVDHTTDMQNALGRDGDFAKTAVSADSLHQPQTADSSIAPERVKAEDSFIDTNQSDNAPKTQENIIEQPVRSSATSLFQTQHNLSREADRLIEARNEDEIESGAIYDTSEYHTEIKDSPHVSSKHSPIKWVVIALVLLVIGALIGAGLFFITR